MERLFGITEHFFEVPLYEALLFLPWEALVKIAQSETEHNFFYIFDDRHIVASFRFLYLKKLYLIVECGGYDWG